MCEIWLIVLQGQQFYSASRATKSVHKSASPVKEVSTDWAVFEFIFMLFSTSQGNKDPPVFSSGGMMFIVQ